MAKAPPNDAARAWPTVVRLPAEIDMVNAHRIGEDLHAAFAAGATTVVADMTATTFCDSLGIRTLVLARKRAASSGAELRVVPSEAVRRVLALLDPEGWLAPFPSMREALTTQPREAVELPPSWAGPDGDRHGTGSEASGPAAPAHESPAC